ncbi:hypothetical protein ACTA71_000265 [Dictyostelium dimigraforme]
MLNSGKNKFGSNFIKLGHVQDMKHLQISLQDHDEISDMDDQDNNVVLMNDKDDTMKDIAALEEDDDDSYGMNSSSNISKQVKTDNLERNNRYRCRLTKRTTYSSFLI